MPADAATTDNVIAMRRPRRWDQPMDPSMTDADVQRLRGFGPLARLDESSFPKSMPLTGILKNDCRLRTAARGEVIHRAGDYAAAAVLVLEGEVTATTTPLPAGIGAPPPPAAIGWPERMRRMLRPRRIAEVRSADQVGATADGNHFQPAGPASPRRIQDTDALLAADGSTRIGPGELFGEVAAMHRTPHSVSVVAASETTRLLEIRWQGLRLLRRDRGFSLAMENHFRQHWLQLHLGEIPLFRFLPPKQLRELADAATLRSFGDLQWDADYRKVRGQSPAERIEAEPVVAAEGTFATDIVLVRSGFGRLSSAHGASHQTVAYLGQGHLFGVAEVVASLDADSPVPLRSSLRAVGFLDTVHLPVEAFCDLAMPHIRRSELPKLATDFIPPVAEVAKTFGDAPIKPKVLATSATGVSENRRQSARATRSAARTADRPTLTGHRPTTAAERTGLLEHIVEQRLTNGREALVIDLNRCTRCDDCVTACATAHDGNPRMARVGSSHGPLQFAAACMHCSDPVCMIGCPTGAIHRDEATGTVQISEPICIGCGVCAKACPYDTIAMVDVFDAAGRPFVDDGSGKAIQKPVKCDGCVPVGISPACLAACPHDAIGRIDLSQSGPLDEFLGRRR